MTPAELDTLARFIDENPRKELLVVRRQQLADLLALARVGLAQQELVKHLEIAVNLLLDFDERNQKLFCRICGCRDEHRLHKDNCKVYAMQMVLAGLPLPAPPAPPEAEQPRKKISDTKIGLSSNLIIALPRSHRDD